MAYQQVSLIVAYVWLCVYMYPIRQIMLLGIYPNIGRVVVAGIFVQFNAGLLVFICYYLLAVYQSYWKSLTNNSP